MRNKLIVFGGFVLLIGLFSIQWGYSDEVRTTKEDTAINFEEGSWREVLALAKKEDKIIFLDVYASWCGPCKAMKRKTFSNSKVGAYFNENFINYAVDAEKGEGATIAHQYRVTGYPTLLFVTSDGSIHTKTMGYHNVKKLIELGESVMSKK